MAGFQLARYIIYCDESSVAGKYFSNFYGGAILNANRREAIEKAIQEVKDEHNIFFGEVKWTKVTESYAAKYIAIVDRFFQFISNGDVKVRIMFTQNINQRPRIEADTGNEYFLLYYQFLKHAFGLRYSDIGEPINLSFFLDDVPTKDKDFQDFKEYLASLSKFPVFKSKNIFISESEITGVDSTKHNILQCVDLILGSMDFRLNEKHRIKPEGQRIRGKRTRAKERVYKHINRRIAEIYPNFNIGVSTGQANGPSDRWNHPYRHWVFVPADSSVDLTKGKKKR